MNKKEIFPRMAANSATTEDKKLFHEWLQTLDVAARIAVMHEFEEYMLQVTIEDRVDEELLESIHNKIGASKVISFRKGWYRIMAAAAILILVVIGAYFFQQNKTDSTLVVVNGPIKPGGNKATLTLAGGQQIILTGANNGNLADQSGVQIIKLNSGLLFYKGKASQIGYNTLTTPRGGQFQLELSDGSHIWLNSASTLRYPTTFTGNAREVELTGEAYFEVANKSANPFMVKVKNVSVNVLGTGFNVMAYDDENAIRTTLVHGSVKVKNGANEMLLWPGEQASLENGGNAFSHSHPDLEQVLAWKDGKFRFENTDIKVIMRQIARWYDVQISFEGDIPHRGLGGSMPRTENASSLLDGLAETGIVHFKTQGNMITVLPGNGN